MWIHWTQTTWNQIMTPLLGSCVSSGNYKTSLVPLYKEDADNIYLTKIK